MTKRIRMSEAVQQAKCAKLGVNHARPLGENDCQIDLDQ